MKPDEFNSGKKIIFFSFFPLELHLLEWIFGK